MECSHSTRAVWFQLHVFLSGIVVCLEFRRDEVKPLCSSCTFYYQTLNVKQMLKNTGMCDIGVLTYYRINIINGTNVTPVFFSRRKNLNGNVFSFNFSFTFQALIKLLTLNLCSDTKIQIWSSYPTVHNWVRLRYIHISYVLSLLLQ